MHIKMLDIIKKNDTIKQIHTTWERKSWLLTKNFLYLHKIYSNAILEFTGKINSKKWQLYEIPCQWDEQFILKWNKDKLKWYCLINKQEI